MYVPSLISLEALEQHLGHLKVGCKSAAKNNPPYAPVINVHKPSETNILSFIGFLKRSFIRVAPSGVKTNNGWQTISKRIAKG